MAALPPTQPSDPPTAPVADPALTAVLRRSVEVIREHQAPTGAYLASPTFPTYRYSWFRDGAFIADAMSRVGERASADAFFAWCADVVLARRAQVEDLIDREARGHAIAPEEHLHTRYTVDGDEAAQPWETFQLDGYGTWLWALDQHLARHGGTAAPHLAAVSLVVRYLATFWAEPSYDWWEEHLEHRHPSTLAAIAAGLRAVAGWPMLDEGVRELALRTADDIVALVREEGVVDGALTKWLGSDAVDASLSACIVPFGLLPPDHPVARRTIARIERELAPAGVHRYLDDVYYGGGQWVLLAGFLGWYHVGVGDRGRAEELLTWMVRQADERGELPEQVADGLLHPDHERPWIERWGPSARPLLWSHAMTLTLAHALGHPFPGPERSGAVGDRRLTGAEPDPDLEPTG